MHSTAPAAFARSSLAADEEKEEEEEEEEEEGRRSLPGRFHAPTAGTSSPARHPLVSPRGALDTLDTTAISEMERSEMDGVALSFVTALSEAVPAERLNPSRH